MELLGCPQGLITFTGERLWPHLDALAQWGSHLTSVQLITAHGDDEQGGPADRLEQFITTCLSHIEVKRFGPINDDDPYEAREAITQAALPEKRWLVDVSGGTRLMFAGGILADGDLDHVNVVYRQPDSPWYQLGAGRARELDGINERALDRFSVRSLIEVTWADAERSPRVERGKIDPEIACAASRTLRGDDWRAEFNVAFDEIKARTGQVPKAGHLFESFVLNMVRQMGVAADDVAREIVLLDGRVPIQEVDIVVNSHGRLHVIDCKLGDSVRTPSGMKPSAPPIGTQIREAFTTKRLLGDGGDQFIFLRPNMTMREEFRSLCEEYGLRVVDKEVLERMPLPDVLAQLLRPPSLSRHDPPTRP